MGKHFGELYKMRGIITHRLSPFEQKAFAGIFSHGFPNVIKRVRSNIFVMAPPFIGAYLLYSWGESEFQRLQRKNPEDYVNDE